MRTFFHDLQDLRTLRFFNLLALAQRTSYFRSASFVTTNGFVTIWYGLRKYAKTSFEKNCFSAWASTLNMGLINKVDMVCLSPVGYGV